MDKIPWSVLDDALGIETVYRRALRDNDLDLADRAGAALRYRYRDVPDPHGG
jgi:hypothetical protein